MHVNNSQTKRRYDALVLWEPGDDEKKEQRKMRSFAMENKKEAVNITYSAEKQKELNAIRAKYAPKGSKLLTNLDKVKAIDAKVESKGTIAGLVVGILGTLLTGLGMSFVLVWDKLALGILIGLVGLVSVAGAYPLYHWVIQKERAKAADEIMKLSEEE